MTDIQPQDPLAAQPRGDEPHDHFALHVGDDPVAGLGIEPDRHLLTLRGFIRFPGISCALVRSFIASLPSCIHPVSARNFRTPYEFPGEGPGTLENEATFP